MEVTRLETEIYTKTHLAQWAPSPCNNLQKTSVPWLYAVERAASPMRPARKNVIVRPKKSYIGIWPGTRFHSS